jgi:hypothetical protein
LVFCFSSRRTEVRPIPAGLEKPQPEQKNSSGSFDKVIANGLIGGYW